MSYDAWRRAQITGRKLRVYRRDVEALRAAFADKSYALVRYPESGFVPLVVRHMNNAALAALFWREPELIVIDGKAVARSLCDLCPSMLSCMAEGRDRTPGFQCRPSGSAIKSNARKRRKGARH